MENETQKFRAPATPKERAIIEATIALMSERGIDGATTAEIARQAGVTEAKEACLWPRGRNNIYFNALRWRREWDSNPRYGCPYTRFPSVRLQPLGHPSC